eukprot:530053-Hanusia_phi.AAC.1
MASAAGPAAAARRSEGPPQVRKAADSLKTRNRLNRDRTRILSSEIRSERGAVTESRRRRPA